MSSEWTESTTSEDSAAESVAEESVQEAAADEFAVDSEIAESDRLQSELELAATDDAPHDNDVTADAADEVVTAEAADADADGDMLEEIDPVQAFKDELAAKFGEWYVIHTYAGYENRVKANLENRIISLNMEDYIFEIQVPMEEVTEIKNGQKKLIKRVRY
ncbi:MAG: transcription termination/antitermination NusG family protein, partial [Actinomycetia bacterium]|nr:transcription termination/antitermination NusG family protein [Actinomycetes bacterium]